MEYSEQDYKIAQILYEKMKTLPIGTEISVSELGKLALEETTAEDGFIPMYEDGGLLWKLYARLCIRKEN